MYSQKKIPLHCKAKSMSHLPQHRASQYTDIGVYLRRINSPAGPHGPVAYAHQDDYYIFGLVESGTGCGIIDFKEHSFFPGDMFVIQPGQVHRLVSSESPEGWLLFADSSFVGNAEKSIFDNFALFASSFRIDPEWRTELLQIISLMANRTDRLPDVLVKATTRRLAEAFIGIVAEAVRDINLQHTMHNCRQLEIVLAFRRLLADHLATSRQPSYYASLLNISAVYLNEVVKAVTGMNVTLYIKNQVVLQAKRLLVHTDLTVKEISYRLGIEDHAYFSRLFLQATGVSPTAFRQRNLE